MTQNRTSDAKFEALGGGDVVAVLQEVARELDDERTVQVFDGGVVVPGWSERPASEEKPNEQWNPRRSAARSRQGAARRQGPAGAAARVGRVKLRQAYERDLPELTRAYPGTTIVPDDQGMWLLVRSAVLNGLDRHATFLVGIPFIEGVGPRAWGFWDASGRQTWIGPRHTNFPDGSVCAFAAEDGIWSEGGSLVALLDLYSVWALRHLYLEHFGRWPGRQHALHPFYRLMEFREGELCSCGVPGARYFECCRPDDLRLDLAAAYRDFMRCNGAALSSRQPPPQVADFINGGPMPTLHSVHEPLRRVLRQPPVQQSRPGQRKHRQRPPRPEPSNLTPRAVPPGPVPIQ